MDEIQQAFKKAEDALGRADSNWSSEATALAGVGYAILALARVIQTALQKNE